MTSTRAQVKTSVTHPLRIAELAAGGGVIGITFCPGKRATSLAGSLWQRDLALDIAVIGAWGAAAVVTLIEEHEFALLQVEALPQAMRDAGFRWHHLPIADVSVPDERFDQRWRLVWLDCRTRLGLGGRVLVHCRGGLGRAGLVAALMLIELGQSPAAAIARVRAVRPGAIETTAQEAYVHRYAGIDA